MAGLRADLDRFTFLLGGDDGEHLLGDEDVDYPPDVRCGFTVDPGGLAASACKANTWLNHVFRMLKQRRSPGQGVNALNLPVFSPDSN